MKKKIFDILPPKEREKAIISERVSGKIPPQKFTPNLLIALILIFGLASLIWATSGFYSKLTLGLQPKTETEVFTEEIEINITQSSPEFENKIIPGRFFEIEKEKQQIFESTGKDFIRAKAEGTIRVYNSQDPPRAINLQATTRFLSSEGGKIFRAPDKIYLPPAQIQEGKLVPSFEDIRVVAQEAGEAYNIGASKFSLPGLVGSPLYYTIYAESESPMTGGFEKEIEVITEEDLENGENILKEGLEKLAKDSLRDKLPKDFILTDESLFIEAFQSSCLEKAGEQVSKFSCQAKMRLKGLAFKFSDLEEIAISFILSRLPSAKSFDRQSLILDLFPKNLVSETGKMISDLKIKVNIHDKISEETLLSQIKGKSEAQIEDIILKNYPQIENINFGFWPFWIKKAPNSLERIKIEIKP